MLHNTSTYNYHLPTELIAKQPLEPRDSSRMLWVNRNRGQLKHLAFLDLAQVLPQRALLVFNNTRVMAWNLRGFIRSIPIDLLLTEALSDGLFRALVRKLRRLKIGDLIKFDDAQLSAQLVEKCADGQALLRFNNPQLLKEYVEQHGLPPLPPYLHPEKMSVPELKEHLKRYQTTYAAIDGAVAAPTAGLHFTDNALAALAEFDKAYITLHTNLGTFKPLQTDDIRQHSMHQELYQINASATAMIKTALAEGRPIIAIGTTTVRALESWASHNMPVMEEMFPSKLYIFPPFYFRIVSGLLTNFHQPKSTLLLLVSALAGAEVLAKAYASAIEQRYRFLSYGDCMLIT